MVSRWQLLLCWMAALAGLPGALPAAQLSVDLDAAQVEMGKHLSARIRYTGAQAVGRADLRQWRSQFHIDRGDIQSDSSADGQVVTVERLRLYPRSSGELLLESIALGGAIAAPQRIVSTPSVRNGIDGTPHWLALPTQVWQGEALEVGIRLKLLHPSNHIAVEDLQARGFAVSELPRVHGDDGSVILRWRLIARDSGQLAIEAPPIEQRGRGRWRYHLPSLTLHVQPLPAYIPPGVPVGRLRLAATLVEQDGARWHRVTVSNDGELPDEVQGLRRRLATSAGRQPADVQAGPTRSEEGVAQAVYGVPPDDWSWGFGRGRELAVTYFDTDSGRLASAHTRLAAVWRMPPGAQVPVAILALLTVLVAGRMAAHAAMRARRRQRLRQRLAQAGDAHAIRRLLLHSGSAGDLSQWAERQPDPTAAEVAAVLNRACYGAEVDIDLVAVKRSVERLLD